jgi:hypothetical protein
MQIGPRTWMLAQTRTVTRDKDGVVGLGPHLAWLTLVDTEGRDVIPIFTTEEKANEYVLATNELTTITAIPITNLGALADLLDQFLSIVFAEALTIDPTNKIGKGQQMPLRQFVMDLRNNIKRPT